MAPFHIMLEIIRILQNSYERYGYKLKMNKGHYLLGKCSDADVAQARRQKLLDLGFHPSIIKVHYDNIADVDERAEAKKTYGVKLLGCFLGTDEFVRESLENYFRDLVTCAKCLTDYPDLQGRLLMFRYCFITNHLQHLQRSVLGSR